MFKNLIHRLFSKSEPYRHKHLEVVGEEVFFHHKGVRYQITSHPFEPCTCIRLNGETIRTLHVAFALSEIIRLLRTGQSLWTTERHVIRTEQLRHILAWAVDSDRTECSFCYAETQTDKTIIPHFLPVSRDSICMGDDCNAPHCEQLRYYCDTLLSDLMTELHSYLPDMRERKWVIIGNDRRLATISFSSIGEFSYVLHVRDGLVTDLHLTNLFCRYE